MNDTELRELLQDTPAPAMSIDTERVVQRGRQRVRNTRIKYAAGLTAAVVAIGAVVGVGVTRSDRATTPAQHTEKTTGFFQRSHDGQFTASPDQTGTATYTYRITAKGTVQRMTSDGAVNLPRVGSVHGSGEIAQDGKRTLVIYPVPSSTQYADIAPAGTIELSMTAVGARSTNGGYYAAIVTSSPLAPAKLAGVWWSTPDGVSSSAGGAHSVTLGRFELWVLPGVKLFGVRSTSYDGTTRIGTSPATLYVSGKGLNQTTGILMPSDAHGAQISYPKSWTQTQALRCADIPGTKYRACVGTGAASNENDAPPTVRWTDAKGKEHTLRQQ